MVLSPLLKKMLATEHIPHALLFTGSGRVQAAETFAKALLDTKKEVHPDFHCYHPEGKTGMHSLSQIRQLIDEVAFFPFEAKWKVFLVYDADRMLPTSSNALLKTFEEPTPHTLILLLTATPDSLLPTIRSRCQMLSFPIRTSQEFTHAQKLLMDLLFSPHKEEYLYLSQELEKICQDVEKGQNLLRKQLTPQYEDLSLVQKEALEKEVSGRVALKFFDQGCQLFLTVLEWARDLIALASGVDHLIHKEYRSHFEAYLSSNSPPDLARLEQKTKEAKISLMRSIKLSTCLEALIIDIK